MMKKKYPVARLHLLPVLAIAAASLASSGFAADGTWDANASGNWSDIANWNGGSGPIADGATFTASFNANLTADRTITLDQAVTIGHLYFANTNATTRTFTLSGANTLTLDADGVGGGTSTIEVAAGTYATIGSSLVLAGSGNIEKTGAGRLTLNTNNSAVDGVRPFTGSFVVSNGTLMLGSSGLNALTGVSVTLGGGADDVTFAVSAPSDGATYATGGITVAAGGSGTVTFSHTTGGSRSVISGAVALNKSVSVNSTSGPLAFSGVISGSGGIYKTGAGSLQLNSTNTYSGGTVLSQGSIRLVSAGGLGSGQLTIGDENTGSSNLNLILIRGTSSSTFNDIHVTDNGTGTVAFNTNASGGGGFNQSLAGNIRLDRSITVSATGNSSADTNFVLSGAAGGVVSGVGGITTNSLVNTRVILTGANTYSGGTFINSGTLRTGNASALGTGQVRFHESAAVTLELNNTALGVQSLSGGSAAAGMLTGGTNGVLTINGGNTPAASFAGIISGAGGLVKNGAGIQILTGENTYSGSTVVNDGVLQLGSDSAVNLSGTSGVTIAGGTLAGAAGNSVLGVGAVSMSSGAVTPGGVGTVGSFTVAAGQAFAVTGGTLNFDLLSSVSFDQILGSGSGTFSLTDATLALSGLTSVGGTYQLFDGFGGVNVITNLTITGLAAGWTADLDITGLLTVSAVPEPSAYAAIAGAVLLGVAALRRRR